MSSQSLLPTVRAVVRVPLDWAMRPERAALLVRDDALPFALIGRWAGGGAVIGSEPIMVASDEDDPFALLDAQPPMPACAAPQSGAVGGGWFGWLGYQLGRRLEPVGASPPPAGGPAPFQLAFYDHVLRLDRDGRWWFEALWSASRATALRARLRALVARARTEPQPRRFSTEAWRATPSGAGHALAVAACRRRIHAGDLFQANICVRLESRLSGAPIDLFVAAAAELAPDRAAFLAGPSGAVASLSPELFLERHGRRVRSAPIKGTRARSPDARLAAAQRRALAESQKDRAENVMIVDLVRNDLGRACRPGSISVDTLCEVRAHAGVWHLVSEVSGLVRDDVGDGDLVRGAFPPGSVSGAPKVAAMNVIAELESSARRLYTGAIGFSSPLAGLELNVAIRTFEFARDSAWLGVGGAVVAESDPLAEAAECVTKAQPLLAAIGSRLEGEAKAVAAVAAPGVLRLGPRPVPRPNPAAGVFETLLVADGRPVAIRRHLERLARSVRLLYDAALPAELELEMRAAASGCDRARLRVDLRPHSAAGPPGVETQVHVTSLGPRSVPVRLCPTTVPGGIGCHKWIDRRLLAALAGADASGEPLLCDLDGVVLEAAKASVFIVEPGPRIVTSPDDGRILPGVTRASVLALARGLGYDVRAERIDLGRLARAREIFVTGAIGGVEPAQLEDRPAGTGKVTDLLVHAWRSATGSSPSPVNGDSATERLLQRS